jgi:hypothetical protein
MKKINNCEVCGNTNLKTVLNLGNHPMCDDLVEINDSRSCKEYPIEILFCETCLTAHQKYQVPKQDLFPVDYHYRARFTADVLNGMKQLVDSCESQIGSLKDKMILDIGCNDGSLLDYFKDKGAKTIGIEPTGAYSDAESKNHFVYNNYLTIEISKEVVTAHGQPDIITFTNVFAHIEDLNEVIDSLKILMSSSTLLIIENHYLGAVLKGNQFDTFYHEHPRTYSFKSFEFISKSIGFKLLNVEFPSRYGGNIRVFIGNREINSKCKLDFNNLNKIEREFLDMFDEMNKNILKWRNNKKLVLKEIFEKYGEIPAKAFPGRSAILVNLLDLDEKAISAVYEKPGSMKIGHYVPGTRIPIYSDNDMKEREKPLLNLAWHISDEIHNYLKRNNYKGSIVDILSEDDFASNK